MGHNNRLSTTTLISERVSRLEGYSYRLQSKDPEVVAKLRSIIKTDIRQGRLDRSGVKYKVWEAINVIPEKRIIVTCHLTGSLANPNWVQCEIIQAHNNGHFCWFDKEKCIAYWVFINGKVCPNDGFKLTLKATGKPYPFLELSGTAFTSPSKALERSQVDSYSDVDFNLQGSYKTLEVNSMLPLVERKITQSQIDEQRLKNAERARKAKKLISPIKKALKEAAKEFGFKESDIIAAIDDKAIQKAVKKLKAQA